MNRTPLRYAALALAVAAAAGCASKDTRDDDMASVSREDTTTTVERTESTHVTRKAEIGTVAPPAASGVLVGVPACDDYLASYRACHIVIGTFTADVLDNRYAELRNTLVSQSNDPELAPTLETRCNSLIAQRDEALAGRTCLPAETVPVAKGETDGDLFDDGD